MTRSTNSVTTEVVPNLEHSDGSSSGSDDRDDDQADKSIAKGGVTTPFPWKLHDMLDDMDKEGNHSIVCWQPHGRAFMVKEPKQFVTDVMKKYFSMSKYASFQRQLNLYGFSRLSHGTDKGAYYHFSFVRNERHLCRNMVRQKIKGTKVRRSLSPEDEPNFYSPEWQSPKTVVPPPQTNDNTRVVAPPNVQKQVAPTQTTTTNAVHSVKAAKKQVAPIPGAHPVKPTAGQSGASKTYYKIAEIHNPATAKTHPTSSLYSLVRDSSSRAAVPAKPFLPPPPVLVKTVNPHHLPPAPAQPTNAPMNMRLAPSTGTAKCGDALFFCGKQFRYLEHLDAIPPLRPAAQQDPLQLQQQQQTYKTSLTNIINSIFNSEQSQRGADTPSVCPV